MNKYSYKHLDIHKHILTEINTQSYTHTHTHIYIYMHQFFLNAHLAKKNGQGRMY